MINYYKRRKLNHIIFNVRKDIIIIQNKFNAINLTGATKIKVSVNLVNIKSPE